MHMLMQAKHGYRLHGNAELTQVADDAAVSLVESYVDESADLVADAPADFLLEHGRMGSARKRGKRIGVHRGNLIPMRTVGWLTGMVPLGN
jgi:hypothetical protein